MYLSYFSTLKIFVFFFTKYVWYNLYVSLNMFLIYAFSSSLILVFISSTWLRKFYMQNSCSLLYLLIFCSYSAPQQQSLSTSRFFFLYLLPCVRRNLLSLYWFICYRYFPFTYQYITWFKGFPGRSDGKESACNVGDLGLIPGLGRSPGGGHGNPVQYSCLENPMDRGAWWAAVHGVAESDTTAWLSISRSPAWFSSLNLLLPSIYRYLFSPPFQYRSSS